MKRRKIIRRRGHANREPAFKRLGARVRYNYTDGPVPSGTQGTILGFLNRSQQAQIRWDNETVSNHTPDEYDPIHGHSEGGDTWMVRYVHKISPSDKDVMGPVHIPGGAFSDRKKLGAALRKAKVMMAGTSIRSFRTEGNRVIVFPSAPGMTTYWHSIILTHEGA
jgi:hypothetical protein